MSWRITIKDSAGVLYDSAPLRTRTEAMICACEIKRGAHFIAAHHSSGETISILEVEIWRRENESVLRARGMTK